MAFGYKTLIFKIPVYGYAKYSIDHNKHLIGNNSIIQNDFQRECSGYSVY